MKVRLWGLNMGGGEEDHKLLAEFELNAEGKVVVRGDPAFVKNFSSDPTIYMDDDMARENPITPDDGEDYLLALPRHFKGAALHAEIVGEEGGDAEADAGRG